MINAEKEILDRMTAQITGINTVNGYENNLDASYPGYKEFEKFIKKKNYLIAFIVPDGTAFEIPFERRLNVKTCSFIVAFRWSGDVDITASTQITNQCLSIQYDFERWFILALDLQGVDGLQHKAIISSDPNIIYAQNIIEIFYKVNITVIV